MKKWMKTVMGTAILAATVGCAAARGAGFVKTRDYTASPFADVPPTEWYAAEVAQTYEIGLMNGIGGGLFSPDGDVTVAEAVTMAARSAAIYAGEEIPAADGEWYAPYVAYAAGKGFFDGAVYGSDLDRAAARHEVATLFYDALPADYFAPKNDVTAIPDVSAAKPYYEKLLALYRAGVVMGSDAAGSFRPEDPITRAEAAAIITRVAMPEKRLQKTLDATSFDDAYTMVLTTSFKTGWRLDNRGGLPKKALGETYGSLIDVSDTAGTALIRDLNTVEAGIVTLESIVRIDGDGAYLAFLAENGEIVHIEKTAGAWKFLNADGSFTDLVAVDPAETMFKFRVELNLDNARSTVWINETPCGTHANIVKAPLVRFQYGTTAASKAVLSPGKFTMSANYALLDEFEYDEQGAVPFGWVGYGAEATMDANFEVMRLAPEGYVTRSFAPCAVSPAAEFMTRTAEGAKLVYTLSSEGRPVLTFASDGTNFTVNGVTVYENYYNNLWYRLRFELDTDAMTAAVKVNGRVVATVPMAVRTTSVDAVSFAAVGSTAVPVDTVRVFRVAEHDDYVPVPTVPNGADDYVIGMNVCPLWRNGAAFGHGWRDITPYDDHKLAIGYFDEGNPETADWEIKYLVEHGVDYQAFCIYPEQWDKMERLNYAEHIFDGFMNAKYSDMSRFAIMYEAANSMTPASEKAWKESYVPFMIENFFKDPRYMVIDNKPVMHVFGNFSKYLSGGAADGKKFFDYLEEEVKKLGFDGMIYVQCGKASEAMQQGGYDACSAYSWGVAGYKLETNIDSISDSASKGYVHTIPTVSVGFNSVGWGGAFTPMITVSDYKKAHEWVRDVYLPSQRENWQKNYVMLSTWNEFGEGTYIFPLAGENGFGYLDTVRNVYTKETENASVDTLPTAEQLRRVTHLYPQDYRYLRKESLEEEAFDMSTFEAQYTVDYSKITATDSNCWSITNYRTTEEGISGVSNQQKDAIVILEKFDDEFVVDDVKLLRLYAKVPKGEVIQIYYRTDSSGSWSESHSFTFVSESDDFADYVVEVGDIAAFSGKLTGLRIDPTQGANVPFTVGRVDFLGFKKGEVFPKEITINGNVYALSFTPYAKEASETLLPYASLLEAGAPRTNLLIPFEPDSGMDMALGCFYTWEKEAGRLTLAFTDHTFVFTVDDPYALIDGRQVHLGYPLSAFDGVPFFPIDLVARYEGYDVTITDDKEVSIETPARAFLDSMNITVTPGKWEFNTIGNAENWTSSHMNLLPAGTYLSCTSVSAFSDPIITYTGKLGLDTARYNRFEIRVRYKYAKASADLFKLYFATSLSSGYSESKTINFRYNGTDSHGEWETYTVDLTQIAAWKGDLTNLRMDPFDASGYVDIDYIRFVEDESYEARLAAAVEEVENLSAAYTIDYAKFVPSSSTAWDIKEIKVDENGVSGVSGADAILILNPVGQHIALDGIRGVRVTATVPAGEQLMFYYTTETATNWAEARKAAFPVSETDNEQQFLVLTDNLRDFKGLLRGFRIDPVENAGRKFAVRKVEFLGEGDGFDEEAAAAALAAEREAYKDLPAAYTIDYTVFKPNDQTAWDVKNIKVDENGVSGTSGKDAILILDPVGQHIALDGIKVIRITAKVPVGEKLRFYYKSDAGNKWSEEQMKEFAPSETEDLQEFTVYTDELKNFKGLLRGFRIDPVEKPDQAFTVLKAEFLGEGDGYVEVPFEEREFAASFWFNFNEIQASGDNCWGIKDMKTTDDGIAGTSSDNDPMIVLPNVGDEDMKLEGITAIRVTAKIPKGEMPIVFYSTSVGSGWSWGRHIEFPVSETDDFAEYMVSTSGLADFKGWLKGIRVDPCEKAGLKFVVKSVEFLRDVEQ